MPVGTAAATEAQKKVVDDAKLKDRKVKNFMFHSIDKAILETILDKSTSKHIWGSTEHKYEGSTNVKRAQLLLDYGSRTSTFTLRICEPIGGTHVKTRREEHENNKETYFQGKVHEEQNINCDRFTQTCAVPYQHILAPTRGLLKCTWDQAENTAACSPQQNGVARRKNSTLLNMVRSMLATRNVPKKYWPEAATWSIHFLNRSPTLAVKDLTPEAWKNEEWKWKDDYNGVSLHWEEDGELESQQREDEAVTEQRHEPGFNVSSPDDFSRKTEIEELQSILALAAQRGYKLFQLDVKSAFLHGEIMGTVYIEQPAGYKMVGQEDKEGNILIGLLYVDLIVTGNKISITEEFKLSLSEILGRFKLDSCNPVRNPIAPEAKLTNDETGRKAVKRVFRYIKGAKEYGMSYKRDGNKKLIAFYDSDYAGNIQTRRSTSQNM
ncbi:retrovirus-related pol polyprotein from transposon TNT 1-94 [Tanacetum coccineum]